MSTVSEQLCRDLTLLLSKDFSPTDAAYLSEEEGLDYADDEEMGRKLEFLKGPTLPLGAQVVVRVSWKEHEEISHSLHIHYLGNDTPTGGRVVARYVELSTFEV